MRHRLLLLLALALFTAHSPAAENVITNLHCLREACRDQENAGRRFAVTGRLISYYKRPVTHEWTVQIADGKDCLTVLEINRPQHKAINIDQPHLNDLISLSGVLQHGQGDIYPGYDEALVLTPASPEDSSIIQCDTPSKLFTHKVPGRLLRITGTIRDFFRDESDSNFIHMSMVCNGEMLHAMVYQPIEDLVDSSHYIGRIATITGPGCDKKSTLRQHIGWFIFVSGIENIVLDPSTQNASPCTDLDNAAKTGLHATPSCISQTEGNVLCIWQHDHALIQTRASNIVKVRFVNNILPSVGQSICVRGIPETDLYFINLVNATWKKTPQTSRPPMPQRDISLRTLFVNVNGQPQLRIREHGQTIRFSGIVRHLPQTKDANTRFYVESDGYIIPVDVSENVSILNDLEFGCRISAAGVCVVDIDSYGLGTSIPKAKGFFLVPRSPDDIVVLSRPSWWTPVRLLVVIAALILLIAAILVWNVTLRRLAERRGRELAEEQVYRAVSDLKVYERTHLAVELHDSLSQTLSGVSMQIDAVGRFADTDRERMREHLGIAAKTLKSCRDELRNCLTDLRSSALEERDMNEAIRRTLEPYSDDAAISIRFFIPREILSDSTAHTILRIIRELVVNAIRHGHADKVRVAGALEDGKLLFSVTDNGCGFDVTAAPGLEEGHFGLQGIRERVDGLDGSFEIESKSGQGSKATVSIVLPSQLNEEKT